MRNLLAAGIVLGLIAALAFATVSTGASTKVDAFTSASVRNYYPPAATFEELSKMTFDGIIVVSTVNPDGSPCASVVIPALIDNKYLAFGLAANQTALNFARGGKVVVTVFVPRADAEKNTGKYADIRKYGARLYCEVVLDDAHRLAVIEKYNSTVPAGGRKLSPETFILEIKGIDPIG